MDYQEEMNQPEDLGEYLDVPSCVESLVSSADQLQQLATQMEQYHLKLLLSYYYSVYDGDDNLSNNITLRTRNTTIKNVNSSKLSGDQQVAKQMNQILKLLPILMELNSYIERCFNTVELVMKRSIYHLDKMLKLGKKQKTMKSGSVVEFTLTNDCRLDHMFLALMNLIHSFISLDKHLKDHTQVGSDLDMFDSICNSVIDLHDNPTDTARVDDEPLLEISQAKLRKLSETLLDLKSTFCSNTTIFQQCMKRLEHFHLIMSDSKTKLGFYDLCSRLEEFISYYCSNLVEDQHREDTMQLVANNKVPSKSVPQTTRNLFNLNRSLTDSTISSTIRAFQITNLYIFYESVFNKKDRTVVKAINQCLSSGNIQSIIHLTSSNSFIRFDVYLREKAPKLSIDKKTLDRLSSRCPLHDYLTSPLDIAREYHEKYLLRVIPLTIRMKHEMQLVTRPEKRTLDQQSLMFQWDLINQAKIIAAQMNTDIRDILAAYTTSTSKSISRNNMISILRLVSLLKMIESQSVSYIDHIRKLDQNQCAINIRTRWRKSILALQKRLISTMFSERKLSMESLLILTSICSKLDLATTHLGQALLSVSLSMLAPSMKQEELSVLNQLILSLILVNSSHTSSSFNSLKLSTNCGFLYWYISTFGHYYNYAIEECPSNFHEVHYFHMAIDDIVGLFVTSSDGDLTTKTVTGQTNHHWLLERTNTFLARLSRELVDQFKIDFLDKICQEFEIELRLQTHSELFANAQNPFKRRLYNFKQLFASSPAKSTFKILNQVIDLRNYLENHLNQISYNLTSIAPHDWYTYDCIMNLARHRYGLQFVDTQLPAQSLDSGLDLLEIIRNLPLFATRYGYDLTKQLFIEKSASSRLSTSSMLGIGSSSLSSGYASTSSNQSLNVVQIQHVARSIQTHGFGVLDSAVNCTYKALRRLIGLFAKQMADDKFKASLEKEHHLMQVQSSKQQQHANQHHPTVAAMTLDRATRIAKRFRISATSLNHGDHNQAISRGAPLAIDLDSLRQTITQVGNLLGFLRLIKSGALSYSSRAADFVSDLDGLLLARLSQYADNEFGQGDYDTEGLLKETAENFDRCLSDYHNHFLPETNYIKIISDTFASSLASSEVVQVDSSTNNDNSGTLEKRQQPSSDDTKTHKRHSNNLSLFHIAIPALNVNYIDYLINCKERVVSRSSSARFGALISDDGFPMGMAFLLTILRQEEEFWKLEWFKQVRLKLQEDIQELQRHQAGEESLRQTSIVTLKRLNRSLHEYLSFEHALRSTLLLFK